jgi:hypothetical protein
MVGPGFMSKISKLLSFGGDTCFFRQHDRDVVTYGIDALAGAAFQAGVVKKHLYGSLADGTHEDGEKFFRNRHQ